MADSIGKHTNHRRRPTLAISLSVIGVAMLSVSALLPVRLVWNVTASAPSGIYAVGYGDWGVGDRVIVRPSVSLANDLDRRDVLPRGKLLIKRIMAGEGDEVCRTGAKVTVNSELVAVAKTASSLGESLPVWAGCRRLGHRDVFLLGDTADSFDGRYFGPTSADEILGRASLMIGFW